MNISANTLSQLEERFRATLINSLPGLKCLHLVGTMSENGHSNLGLFNSVFHLGASPALLGMVFRPGSHDHDTLSNIKRTGFYTLNNVLSSFYQQAHQTSARYPSGVSEFVECGLTEYFFPNFQAPFVAEASIKIGMELRQLMPVALNNTTIVIGEIKCIQLNENILEKDGYINHEKAGTISVGGLDGYFENTLLERLSYAKPNQQVPVLKVQKEN